MNVFLIVFDRCLLSFVADFVFKVGFRLYDLDSMWDTTHDIVRLDAIV